MIDNRLSCGLAGADEEGSDDDGSDGEPAHDNTPAEVVACDAEVVDGGSGVDRSRPVVATLASRKSVNMDKDSDDDEPVSQARSFMMSRIRGSDTDPEMALRSELWRRGLVYQVKTKAPVGRPDLVIESSKIAVFIDGCFWHGCPDHYVRPRTRDEFWSAKLAENTTRDAAQTKSLEELGWRVVRVWEHEVYESLADVIETIVNEPLDGADLAWRVVRVEALDADGTMERRHLRELRGLAPDRAVEQLRHTRKWKRPTRAQG